MVHFIRRRLRRFLDCPMWQAKIALAVMSATAAAGMLRILTIITATTFPLDGMAAEVVQRIVALSAIDFAFACATGSMGGAVSLFRERRRDWSKFRLMEAIGHMVTAQFSALLTYLLAVNYQFPFTLALFAAGIMGWLGNAGIERLSAKATQVLGLRGRK